ncbi:NAD(P)-dependent oxidoreductase [Ornithinimicrobium sp. Arc0846-15]|nr:NAD(P)-dependent oxidoreductase [Ornithinimicrobium laminariae]
MPEPDDSAHSALDPVAVVGLGRMGSGIAASYARSGRRVYGVDPFATHTVEGVELVDLSAAMRETDVMVLSLPGGDQVQSVVDALVSAECQSLIIDTSTCDPAETQRRAAQLAKAGGQLVDAPVSGGPSGAEAGQLTVFLGCPVPLIDRVSAELRPLAGQVNHVGEVGAGNTAKLMNNLLCAINLCSARAVLDVCAKASIEPDRLIDAINTASGRSGVTEVNMPRWVLNETFDSGFPVGLMARDVDLALEVATNLSIDSPVAAAAGAMWSQLLQETGPETDFNRMAQS